MCAYYIRNVTQTVVTTAFCKLLRKSSDLARPQLQRFPPPPRCPPVLPDGIVQKIADTRRARNSERRATSRRSLRGLRLPLPGLFSSLLSSRIEDHRKEGQRESQGRAVRHGKAIAIHCFLHLFLSNLSIVDNRLTFLLLPLLHLTLLLASLSLFLSSPLTALGEDLSARWTRDKAENRKEIRRRRRKIALCIAPSSIAIS